ncbi:hypothetical protein ONZ51_g11260 [Trametes cubensis]|uniref:Uncharacterized protein n=1 Tax=Trametes cubensis TaxID=1111947 RepID=A0AAD7THW0_9APHY|nr:hypothetical protein ONZ51_g11260 [Trametes cubensis]
MSDPVERIDGRKKEDVSQPCGRRGKEDALPPRISTAEVGRIPARAVVIVQPILATVLSNGGAEARATTAAAAAAAAAGVAADYEAARFPCASANLSFCGCPQLHQISPDGRKGPHGHQSTQGRDRYILPPLTIGST